MFTRMFTRIYAGIFSSVLLAALLSFALYSVSHENRRQLYEHQALAGSMQLISHSIQRLRPENQHRYLDIVAQLLGGDLKTLALASLENLSLKERKQLQRGVPLVLPSQGDVIQWLLKLNETTVIRVRINSLTEQQFRAQALLIVSELNRTDSPLSIDKLQQYFAYPLKLSPAADIDLDKQQRSRLNRDSVVVTYEPEQRTSFNVYAPWDKERTLVLGPIPQFNSLPLDISIGMIAITVIVIVAMAYWLVFRLERRLRAISTVVNKFGSGDLNARVSLVGRDYIAELGKKINAMAARIENLLQSQREIMQAVSHEFRTPLSRIRFRLEILEDQDDEQNTQSKTSGIRNDITQLEQLIDEVLEHHKLMQEPALTRSLLTLGKPIQEVLGNLRELFPKVAINTNLGSPAGLEVHPPSFYRLLQNLVSNACKHANRQVLISTFKTSSANCLAVEDDGPGVSPPERDKIFEAFYRTDNSRNKQTGGYGLGLAIVSRIISMHDARIEVSESSLGGAKFTVLFPLSTSNKNADSSVQNP